MSEERLARIETKLDALIDRADKDDERWGRMNRTVYGNNGQPGLLIAVDRLQQVQERSRWLQRTIVGALAVLFLGGAWSLLVS